MIQLFMKLQISWLIRGHCDNSYQIDIGRVIHLYEHLAISEHTIFTELCLLFLLIRIFDNF